MPFAGNPPVPMAKPGTQPGQLARLKSAFGRGGEFLRTEKGAQALGTTGAVLGGLSQFGQARQEMAALKGEIGAIKVQRSRDLRNLRRDASMALGERSAVLAASGARGTASMMSLMDATSAEAAVSMGRVRADAKTAIDVLRQRKSAAKSGAISGLIKTGITAAAFAYGGPAAGMAASSMMGQQ